MEGKRGIHLFERLRARRSPHGHGCRRKYEMTIGMYGRLQSNALKIPPFFESIPMSDGLANGFVPLNAVMPNLARNNFPIFSDFMPCSNRHERTPGDAV